MSVPAAGFRADKPIGHHSLARYARHFVSLENSFMKLPSEYRFPFAMTRFLTFPFHGPSLSPNESHIPSFPPAD